MNNIIPIHLYNSPIVVCSWSSATRFLFVAGRIIFLSNASTGNKSFHIPNSSIPRFVSSLRPFTAGLGANEEPASRFWWHMLLKEPKDGIHFSISAWWAFFFAALFSALFAALFCVLLELELDATPTDVESFLFLFTDAESSSSSLLGSGTFSGAGSLSSSTKNPWPLNAQISSWRPVNWSILDGNSSGSNIFPEEVVLCLVWFDEGLAATVLLPLL